MSIIDPILGAKIVFVLGITNIIALFLVFFSCRCLIGLNFVKKMWKYKWYQKFYNSHCYFWWFFFLSVLTHATLAILIFGNPF